MFGKGQRADAVAGGGEDGVGDGGERRRKSGFAEAGGRIVRFQVVDFDGGWRVIDAHGFVFVEVALSCAAAIDGDFLRHQLRQSFDDGALRLVFCVERINDLAADVADAPDFFDFHFFRGIYVNERDGGKVATMRKMKRYAHTGAFR